MNEKEVIKNLVIDGFEVKFKDNVICDLRQTLKNQVVERKYQVYNSKEVQIYNNISEAVDRFITLAGR